MFGSLDCSVYHHLCSLYNIRSYPTIIFFHNSVPHLYSDEFGAQDIAAFVEDIMHPTGKFIQRTLKGFASDLYRFFENYFWIRVNVFVGPFKILKDLLRDFKRISKDFLLKGLEGFISNNV